MNDHSETIIGGRPLQAPNVSVLPPSPTGENHILPAPNGSVNSSSSGMHKSSVIVEYQPKRRISVISDPSPQSHITTAYDNLAFEQNPRRKISQTSTHSHSEIGPVRRKSILKEPSLHDNESDRGSTQSFDNNRPTKPSALDILNTKINQHHQIQTGQSSASSLEKSCLYAFCLKCRGEQESPPYWEPPFWQKLFPYPLCPSFRQFSRMIVLILIGVLLWITVYIVIGDAAAPGGQLFGLVVLTVASNFGGYLISLTTLPRLIGMLLVGILFQNIGWTDLDGDFSEVTAHMRKIALTIILTRAGLEMEPDAFKKVYKTILKLGIIPWFIECVIMAVMAHFLLKLPWVWAFMLGSIIAAVSPAVVVPCLFRLRTKGYGVIKGIPTLIVAVAGIDDALSVAIFGIIATVMFSHQGVAYEIAQAPICIVGGLCYGVIWGHMGRIFPEKGDNYVVPLRTLLLLAGGLTAVYGSEHIGFEGAGPLAVVFSAFTSNLFWSKQGWDVEDNPVSTAFEIFWMIFEPILFGITGATIKIRELDTEIVYLGAACIFTGIIARIFCTVVIAFGDRLNTKEKFFVALSWMAKATVQAALGPVAAKRLKEDATDEEKKWAYVVQTICIFSIVLTAPLGAILISISGTKLLTKTRHPPVLEGWRRSNRPSMRDISIIEEEEREDPEATHSQSTNILSTNSVYTLTK